MPENGAKWEAMNFDNRLDNEVEYHFNVDVQILIDHSTNTISMGWVFFFFFFFMLMDLIFLLFACLVIFNWMPDIVNLILLGTGHFVFLNIFAWSVIQLIENGLSILRLFKNLCKGRPEQPAV